jgi:hypothetical protein
MGAQYSSDIKYVYTNMNGTTVSIPYIRLLNGQWIPLQQYQSRYYPQYNQRALIGGNYVQQNLVNPLVANRSIYPIANQ